jgi:drug/metabolite transporter (DMT)-like permease
MRPLVALKAFLAISFWGASFVATKVVLRELSPITIISVRFALGLVTLIPIVSLKHEWRHLRHWDPTRNRDLGWFLLLGFNGIFVHQLLQVNGLTSTSATNTGWMVALIPVFTALLAWMLLGEGFGFRHLSGLALAVAGTLLVVSRGELRLGVIDLPATRGDLYVLLSAPNWAVFSVLSKRILTRYPPSLMITVTMGLGWLMLLPLFVAAAGWQELPGLTVDGWVGLLFLGLLCSGIAYVFWYDALDAAGAGQVASFLYLEPLVTLIVAVLLLDERPTPGTLAGGGLILAGVWLVNWHRG